MARHFGHPQPKKKRTARKAPAPVVPDDVPSLLAIEEPRWHWPLVKITAGTVSLFALVVIVFVLAMWMLGAVGWA